MNKTMQEMLQKANRVIIPESGMNKDNIIRTGPIVRKIQKNVKRLEKTWILKRKQLFFVQGVQKQENF